MPKLPQVKRDINSVRVRPSKEPAWKGPWIDGVTQSMLCDYLCCKERFRVRMIEGLQPYDKFNVAIEFGHMWHLCEEAHAGQRDWLKDLTDYAAALSVKYRTDNHQILKWYNVIVQFFPIYLEHWAEHEDEQGIIHLLQEYDFRVRIDLPSVRSITLRGKIDGIDFIQGQGIYLKENKTKSKIDVQTIQRQLNNDIQVMTYMTATELLRYEMASPDHPLWLQPLRGVRYNVIRRPLSGGVGSIRPRQATKHQMAESMDEFYERLASVIYENKDSYFERWKCEISIDDLTKFQEQTLFPVLDNLLDDYEWWSYRIRTDCDPYNYSNREEVFPHHISRHYRLPYGIYNVIRDGGFDEIDDYLNTGSKVGIEICKNFFPELNNADSSEATIQIE